MLKYGYAFSLPFKLSNLMEVRKLVHSEDWQ